MRTVRSPTSDPKGSRDRLFRLLMAVITSLGFLLLLRLTLTSSTISTSISSPTHLRRHLASSTLPSSFAASFSNNNNNNSQSPTSSLSSSLASLSPFSNSRSLSSSSSASASRPLANPLSNTSRAVEISLDNRNDLVYLHDSDILLMTMAKAGTSSTWHWIYPGVTGRPRFDMKTCKTYIHDIDGPCWKGEASFVYKLPPTEQYRILTSPDTLRVAIQRDPYSRLISSFKSKYTCEDQRFGTDVHNRLFMVPALRRQAGWGPGKSCMNITEFAEALDATRRVVHEGKSRLKSLRQMDVHIRPQEMYFDEIDYHMVLDVTDLWDVKHLQPIINRLRHKDLVKNGITLRHSSGGSELLIPDYAASLLHNFALESKVGAVKYFAG